jgi:hypothetical protein
MGAIPTSLDDELEAKKELYRFNILFEPLELSFAWLKEQQREIVFYFGFVIDCFSSISISIPRSRFYLMYPADI